MGGGGGGGGGGQLVVTTDRESWDTGPGGLAVRAGMTAGQPECSDGPGTPGLA